MTRRLHLLHLARTVGAVMDQRHAGVIAAGVAFYTLFALFPGMAATIAIWSFFADPAVMRDYLGQISDVIPDAAFELLASQLEALLAATPRAIGWTTSLSLMLALYSVHNAVSALVSGLNAIQGMRPRRGVLRVFATALLTLGIVAIALGALLIVVSVPLALHLLPLGPVETLILSSLPWLVMFLVLLLVLGLFYRWGPTGRSGALRHSWFSPGAFVAALLWVAASIAFSLYLANFGVYNRIYGSIGAVAALLMWLYISAYIVLLGAALNAARGSRQ